MLIVPRRCGRHTRGLIKSSHYQIQFYFSTITTTTTTQSSLYPFNPSSSAAESINSNLGSSSVLEAHSSVILAFKEWFLSRKNPLLDSIFEILRTPDEDSAAMDSAISRLNLRLTESLVLDVLAYGKNDVLSCLKFFDWAGRQPGFHHTRATFTAIFKILSRAKLMSLMLDFLDSYTKQRYTHRVRYYNTLVIGYAVAGKPEIALQMFGRMRFNGFDLDSFAYHVLLNALVEEKCFEAVDMIVDQIRLRRYETEITPSIMMKSFCKQNLLDEAASFLRNLIKGNRLDSVTISIIVDALCKDGHFEKAAALLKEIGQSGYVPLDPAYTVWIRDLVNVGKLDGPLEFLKSKELKDGYVPNVFRYNKLICKLLKDNRLEEVCHLLFDMKERNVLPDDITMNATLCFFCKVGMLDVAMKWYDSRAELGLSVNSMLYNYLINALLGDVNVDEAYRVLRTAIEQGYFPGKRTIKIIADALCREGKIEKIKELVSVSLNGDFMPKDLTYDNFISALCRAGRVEDGYMVHGQLNRLNKVAAKRTYFSLITGFSKSNRGDIAARLLIEMQEKGHIPDRKLFRTVIRSLCQMDDPEKQFFRLLEMQLSRHQPSCLVCNHFIDGAGQAKKFILARGVYEMMVRSGIKPTVSSDILMLQSYLKSEKIVDALNFFHDVSTRRKIGRKLWNRLIVGLCKANRPNYAMEVLWKMREDGLKPSMEAYEELVKSLCDQGKFYMAFIVIDDLMQIGRRISSFIGNVLLLHSLSTRKVYDAWVNSRNTQNLSPRSLRLGKMIGAFSGPHKENQGTEELEELIQQCFPLDIYTYNMLLRRQCMIELDHVSKYLDMLHEKGYEPNRWTYETVVHAFLKHGQNIEAQKWIEVMFEKGFDLSESTKTLVY